jgi:hypothetical protein
MRAERGLIAPAALIVAVAALGGCVDVPGSFDGPMAVRMHIRTTSTTVEVDASGWFADTSAVYLCPTAPPVLPEAAADRVGWTPGGECHDFGRHPSRDGLTISLPLSAIDGETWPAFESAEDWYLLLLDLDGDRVSSAVRSRIHAPMDVDRS